MDIRVFIDYDRDNFYKKVNPLSIGQSAHWNNVYRILWKSQRWVRREFSGVYWVWNNVNQRRVHAWAQR